MRHSYSQWTVNNRTHQVKWLFCAGKTKWIDLSAFCPSEEWHCQLGSIQSCHMSRWHSCCTKTECQRKIPLVVSISFLCVSFFGHFWWRQEGLWWHLACHSVTQEEVSFLPPHDGYYCCCLLLCSSGRDQSTLPPSSFVYRLAALIDWEQATPPGRPPTSVPVEHTAFSLSSFLRLSCCRS